MTLDTRVTSHAVDMTFGEFAEAIDMLETANGERAGGLSPIVSALVDVLAAEIAATTPATLTDRAWLIDRQSRAASNEWVAYTDGCERP